MSSDAPPPMAKAHLVLPPPAPLEMPEQSLLPSPAILQRGFWARGAAGVFGWLARPVGLVQGVYVFFTAGRDQQDEAVE